MEYMIEDLMEQVIERVAQTYTSRLVYHHIRISGINPYYEHEPLTAEECQRLILAC